jgi:hypothetical protein
MEPILIVMFLALIIGLLLLFSLRIGDREVEVTATKEASKQDLLLLGRIANLPELSCPKSESAKTYCIDMFKAEAFRQLMKDDDVARSSYYPLLGASEIAVEWIDMDSNGASINKSMVLYDNLNSSGVRPAVAYSTMYNPASPGAARMFATVTIYRRAG